MKKILLVASILALALAGCKGGKEEFKLTATNLPAELEGQYAYIYNDAKEVVDSVLVTEGAITYTSEIAPNEVYVLNIAGQPITFVKEQGEFKFDMVAEEEGAAPVLKCISAPETSLFKSVEKMNEEFDTALKPITTRFQAIVDSIKANEALKDSLMPQIEAIQNEYVTASNEIAKRYFEANKDNFIGLQAFRQLQFENDAEMVAAYEGAGDIIKNNAAVKAQYNKAVAAEATKVGAQFVDFEMVNGDGEKVALSSFRQEGKYLLVDFFASWCGPCKASMPTLAELDKNFGKKGLVTLSIATWDKVEDYKKAVEDHKITWANIIDTENKGADVYGVAGVPTFILFSPEGEILVRSHDVNDVKVKLDELVKL